jgi:hypothetical protein
MRPDATLGTFEKPEEAATSCATSMSGECHTLPIRVPLHCAKNNLNNVIRYKFKVIVSVCCVPDSANVMPKESEL